MTAEPTQSSTLSNIAEQMLWRGNAGEAITLLRVEGNIGLKDAQDLVDDLCSAPGYCSTRISEGRSPVAVSAQAGATGDKGVGVGARRLGSPDS
jgi:hypothetical protein